MRDDDKGNKSSTSSVASKGSSSASSAASKGSSSTSAAAKTSSAKTSSSPVVKAATSVSTASRVGESAPPPSLVSSSGAASRGDSVVNKAARPVNTTSLVAYDAPRTPVARAVTGATTSLRGGTVGTPTRAGGGLDFVNQTAERSGENYRERYGVASPGATPGSLEDWFDTAQRGTIGAIAGGLNSLVPPLIGLGMGTLEAAESIDPGNTESDPRSTKTLDALMGGYAYGSDLTEQALAPYIAMDPRLARNAETIADVASVALPVLGPTGKLAGGLDVVQSATKLPKGANIVADNLLRDIALKRTPDELQRILRARDLVGARAAADEALDRPISDLLAERASADIRELRTNAFEQSSRPTIAATDDWLAQRYGAAVPEFMGPDEAADILRGSSAPKLEEGAVDVSGPLARAGVVAGGMGATGLALALWDAKRKADQRAADELARIDASSDPVGRGASFDELRPFLRGTDEAPRMSENPINLLGYPVIPERLSEDVFPLPEVLGQEDALNLPGQEEGFIPQEDPEQWNPIPGEVIDSNPDVLFEDNPVPLNQYTVPENPELATPEPGAWAVPDGMVLAPNGYYYSKAADGSWQREGRVEGYSPSQLYRAANKGAFEDPANVTARSTPAPAPRPAGQETMFDKLIGFGGTALENTALGSIAKGLFPDMWFGAGEAIKSLDNGTYGAVDDEQDPDWWRSLASEVRPTPAAAPPPADDDTDDTDDDDDDDTGTGGTVPVYDRNGLVVFPDLPPYNPGRDDEWLYFRKRLAGGGPVGYADGGAVDYAPRDRLPATAGLDPRLALIADAEDALAGELPDPEPVLTAFVQQFGPAALDRLREQVSKGLRMRGDNARLVRGPGGPTDDAIPARINGRQEARLSDGEFVMTAEAVKNAGDGDPRAGADRLMELNEMLASGKRSGKRAPVEVVG